MAVSEFIIDAVLAFITVSTEDFLWIVVAVDVLDNDDRVLDWLADLC